MAQLPDHLRQWKHNRELLAVIPTAYPDWLVTVTFYVALHAIDALLAFDKVERINSHDARNEVLFKTNRYSKIRKFYFPLHDLSRTVRYFANPSEWIPAEEIDANVFRRYLYPLENSVEGLLQRKNGFGPIMLAGAQAIAPRPSA